MLAWVADSEPLRSIGTVVVLLCVGLTHYRLRGKRRHWAISNTQQIYIWERPINCVVFSESIFFCRYGGAQIGIAGPANIEKHRNAPSEMKRIHNCILLELWSGFVLQLVATCRHPLFLVSKEIYIALAVFFRGPLQR